MHKMRFVFLLMIFVVYFNFYTKINAQDHVLNTTQDPTIAQTKHEGNTDNIELLVKFKEKAGFALGKNNTLSSDQLIGLGAEYGFPAARTLTKTDGPHRKGYYELGLDRIYTLRFSSVDDPVQLVEDYRQTGLFESVHLNSVVTSNRIATPMASSSRGPYTGMNKSNFMPNDTLLFRQYYVKNNGDFPNDWSAKEGADMDLDLAWDVTTGDSSTVVAVIGTGIALNEPEFQGRIWYNPDEIPGNNLDDDNNGKIDDINGWNFRGDWNNVDDVIGYGTTGAGLIGANGDNITAYAGINWQCKFMPLAILNSRISGNMDDLVASIIYAVDEGADIINCDIGGDKNDSTLYAAARYAYDNNVTMINCVPLGGGDQIDYPAAYPETIAVGATDAQDRHLTYDSATGDYVDIVAPGDDMYVIYPSKTKPYDYSFMGPGCSCDLVTGVASLLKGLDKSLTPDDIKHILTTTADDTVGRPGDDVPGWDKYHGWGRVNAFKAVNHVVTGVKEEQRTPSGYELSQNYPNPFNPKTTVQYILPKPTEVAILIYNLTGQLVYKSNLGIQPEGIHSWSWKPDNDLASGMYIMSLQAGEYTVNKKMIFTR